MLGQKRRWIDMRVWFSGRTTHFQCVDPGSIPGTRTKFSPHNKMPPEERWHGWRGVYWNQQTALTHQSFGSALTAHIWP
jgi:hypothetical protein